MREALRIPEQPPKAIDQAAEPGGARCASRGCGFAPPNPGDGQPRRIHGVRLCRSCRDRVCQDLVSLPALYEECLEMLANVPVGQLRERVSGGRSRGAPLNTAAITARSVIMGTLASWSGLVVSERRISDRPYRTAEGLSSFLIGHLDWLAVHPAAGDFADEVATTADTARRSTGTADRMELGPCAQPDCDQVIFADRQQVGEHTVRRVRCEAGHVWEAHQWLLLAHQMRRPAVAGPAAPVPAVRAAGAGAAAGAGPDR